MSFLFKKGPPNADVPDMTSSALVDGPERGPEKEGGDAPLPASAPMPALDVGGSTDPLASHVVPRFGTLHFDESVVGLTIADVSVVLVGDYPVAVPIPRSLAQQCGFTLLDVEDDVLLSIGVIAVELLSEPVPPRPKLPTSQQSSAQSGFESFASGSGVGGSGVGSFHDAGEGGATGDAQYLGLDGHVTEAPRTATDVSGEIGPNELADKQQQLTDLAPALLASQKKFELVPDNEVVDAPEQLWDKLAKRGADLAPASKPLEVLPGFTLVDSGDALAEQVDELETLNDVADVARPFATSMAKRTDVGYVEYESWPDVERRLNDRDETSPSDRTAPDVPEIDEYKSFDDPTAFMAVTAPESKEFLSNDLTLHSGLLSPLAADIDAPGWAPNVGAASTGLGDSAELNRPVGPIGEDGPSFESSGLGGLGGPGESGESAPERSTGPVPPGVAAESIASSSARNLPEYDETGWKTGMPVWPRLGAMQVDGVKVTVDGIQAVHVDVAKPLPAELAFGQNGTNKSPRETTPLESLGSSEPTQELAEQTEEQAEQTEERPETFADSAFAEPVSNVWTLPPSVVPDRAPDDFVEPEEVAVDFTNSAVWADGMIFAPRHADSNVEMRLDGSLADPGQLVVIFAADANERSQLCRVLAGFERLDGGDLKVGSVFINKLTAQQRSVREAGSLAFANAKPPFVRDLTVIENLELPLLINGDDPTEARQLVIDTLDDLELADMGETVASKLSPLDRVRFGVLRAILSAEVAVLDDPASEIGADLDSPGANTVLDLVRVAIEAGITVVYATSNSETRLELAAEPNAKLFDYSNGTLQLKFS
jgi:ABC-type ATPase involved in cell division